MSELFWSRIISLALVVPSFQANIGVINCVLQAYRGQPIQKGILLSSAIAIGVDVASFVAQSSWLANNAWPSWGPVTVGLNFAKRVYSVMPVYLVYLRFAAIANYKTRFPVNRLWGGSYAALSLTTGLTHIGSYIQGGWVPSIAHSTATYEAYRYLNCIAVFYYSLLALSTDFNLLRLCDVSVEMRKRYQHAARWYNIKIYILYEIVTLLAVTIGLLWGASNPSIGYGPYVEQLLLAFITLNCSYSIKAASGGVPGQTTGSTESQGAAPTGGGSPTRKQPTKPRQDSGPGRRG